MEQETIIIVSAFSAATAVLLLLVIVLFTQVASLRKRMAEFTASGRLRVQKLTVDDKNHAFHNPAISPDEELARRGFSMYVPEDDVESGRGTERQTGGEFVEELARELDSRQQRRQHSQQEQSQREPPQQQQQQPPPFLLQAIEENKRRSRNLANPVANSGRQSETNPNFIY